MTLENNLKLLPFLSALIQKNFSGKLNILYEHNSQFLAYIAVSEKRIVKCRYDKWVGEAAILELLIYIGNCSKQLIFVEEPEIIDLLECDLLLDLNGLNSLLATYFERVKYAPPKNLKVLIDGDFIVEGEDLSLDEFKLLNTISDYSKVEEIYNNCLLSPAQVLVCLVGLRAKRALKVLGHSRR